jgi:hypothetical protein
MKKLVILILCTWSGLQGISGDFGRRYGSSSRLLQKPLYFKESVKKKCKQINCKNNYCATATCDDLDVHSYSTNK